MPIKGFPIPIPGVFPGLPPVTTAAEAEAVLLKAKAAEMQSPAKSLTSSRLHQFGDGGSGVGQPHTQASVLSQAAAEPYAQAHASTTGGGGGGGGGDGGSMSWNETRPSRRIDTRLNYTVGGGGGGQPSPSPLAMGGGSTSYSYFDPADSYAAYANEGDPPPQSHSSPSPSPSRTLPLAPPFRPTIR